MDRLQIANLSRKQQTLIPKRLYDAVEGTAAAIREQQFAAPPERIEAGQLWTLSQSRTRHRRQNRPPRYAVVVDVRHGTTQPVPVQVALLSVEIEYAGPGDVVVSQSASPIGCAFMVECWNMRAVPTATLETPIGPLNERAIQTVRDILRACHAGHELRGAVEMSGTLFRVGLPDQFASFRARERRVMRGRFRPYQ